MERPTTTSAPNVSRLDPPGRSGRGEVEGRGLQCQTDRRLCGCVCVLIESICLLACLPACNAVRKPPFTQEQSPTMPLRTQSREHRNNTCNLPTHSMITDASIIADPAAASNGTQSQPRPPPPLARNELQAREEVPEEVVPLHLAADDATDALAVVDAHAASDLRARWSLRPPPYHGSGLHAANFPLP